MLGKMTEWDFCGLGLPNNCIFQKITKIAAGAVKVIAFA